MDQTNAEETSAAAWRWRVYPAALLAAVGIGLAVLAVGANASEAPAQEVGGDFPAFYGAARIAAAGDWSHLYEFDRQVEAQADLQAEVGSARYFAYPPQVAVALRPLASLSYGAAYLVYTAAMFLALVAAVKLTEPLLPRLAGRAWAIAAIALSFWPMMRAVTGGSNTALSLLLIVAGWRLVEADHRFAAGVVLSLLLSKPQLAVPIVGLLLVIGLYRVVAGALAGSAGFYLLGVLLLGWGWPLDWWDVAQRFNTVDSEVNGFSAVSWLGFLENALGVGHPLAVSVGWGLAGLTVAGLVWLWHRHGRSRLRDLLAVAMPGILLLSPHALSHDTALVLLSVAVWYEAERLPRPLVVTVWVLGLSQAWIEGLGFSPGFFLLVLAGAWSLRSLGLLRLRRPALQESGT